MDILTSCTSLKILVLIVDPGHPQGAPTQLICRGALYGYPGSMFLIAIFLTL
jgi:hypothetical protein